MCARLEVCAALLCAAAALACQSTLPATQPARVEPAAGVEAYDVARAWDDLETFAGIGPRVMGSEGAARARRYIVSELQGAGLQTQLEGLRVEREGQPPLRITNVAAVIPGASSDLLLLLAPYDTRPYATFRHQGVNQGGSGAAVLLEMARALSRQPLPYTIWFVFLEGEAPLGEGAAAEPSHFGSRGLAQRLVELDAVPRIRLGVVIDRVCDADLEIARDLGSHRIYREEFWHAAQRLDRSDTFPRRSDFQSPRSSHEELKAIGVTRVVTLTDTSFGGDEPPGLYSGNEDDTIAHCSPESLATVGLVTLEALDTISRRLARIDRFSRSPVEGAAAVRLDRLREEEESPPVDETPTDGTPEEPTTADGGDERTGDEAGDGQAEASRPPEQP